MNNSLRAARRRPNMRKAVFLFPSGLTLLNLFFGVFAIIAASRLEFTTAGVYVVIGGICDALDGRVARATNAGSQFGEELDSLVDAITFGLAPAMIMYFAVLNRGGWDWVWVFAFAACAVLRLARFNIEQAGTAKTYFQGLPSPAAGITLASYYWFSQSWLYSYGAIANLKWHVLLRLLIAVLGALMISNVPYPSFPRTGFRSMRSFGATFVVLGAFLLLLSGKLEYFFPIAVLYVLFGLGRWLLSGLFERRQPTVPYDLSEGEEDEEDDYDFELIEEPIVAPRGARNNRVRSATERPERADRSKRAKRPDRPEIAVAEAEPEATIRPARAARPERTEAERAARREKREKRESRTRSERSAEPTQGVDAISLGEPTLEREPASAVPAEALHELTFDGDENVSIGTPAPARKRKRRRRRGSKDRGEGLGGAGTADEGISDAVDSGGDEEPYLDEAPNEPRPAYSPPTASPPAPAPVPPRDASTTESGE